MKRPVSMTTEELGKALAEARIARGLSLLDVERDTRISGKYLKALEEARLELLPAPVYARAFMRTYAQYLGLNAPAFVQSMPGARPEPELPPLPAVGREATKPLLSANWLVAGGVIVFLLIVGVLLFWNRGGDEGTAVRRPSVGAGAEEVTPPPSIAPPGVALEPGVVPDVEEQPLLVALQALVSQDLRYLVLEVELSDAAPQTVFRQSPSPGTLAEEDTVVTLLVSRE
jgi:transcriptional regulator with XRE-family HTH domain